MLPRNSLVVETINFVLHVVKLEVYFVIPFVQEKIHANFWKLSVKF